MTSSAAHESALDAVAIIGMAGRFPRAQNVAEFWRNLRDGVECVSFFSDEELRAAGVDPAVLAHPRYVKAKGALADADLFDAGFFGYTPNEARAMDPQQRIFLECGWTALEHAGYAGDAFSGSVGVYAGASLNTYLLHNLVSHPEIFQFVGADKDYVASRVSYKLNLKGPSVVVQTACSTSLVAVCQACQSLLTYQCDLALAGGVSVVVPKKSGYVFWEGGILSPEGRCRAFDAGARGTVPGNGVGIVVLKRLAEAIQDRDDIYAVIRGFALNNDGAAKIGYTAPSIDGQAQVIVMAQTLAGVSPDTISYVEAHGTGTDLGDPIEVAALTQAFRARTAAKQYCALGSVKTNIGHLDAAAGVASLIKTTLALRHRELPPTLHFERPNPKIDFESGPFYVNTQLREWSAGSTPRRAGVSSFGLGGTNAHVVLEEGPARQPSSASRPDQVLLLSARTTEELARAAQNLGDHLDADDRLADVAYTLAVGRKRFPVRAAVVCSSRDEAVRSLRAPDSWLCGESTDERREGAVLFAFPATGAELVARAWELAEQEPAFMRVLSECADRLLPRTHIDLRRSIAAAAAGSDESSATAAHAALFAVQYATARLWKSWGVRPVAVVGVGVGECVAACLSGAISFEHALDLAVARGRFIDEVRSGSIDPADAHDQLAATVAQIAFAKPQIVHVSSVTGIPIDDKALADAAYWVRNIVEAEDLRSIAQPLLRLDTRILLQAGSGDDLASAIRDQLAAAGSTEKIAVLSSLPGAGDDRSSPQTVAHALAALWLHGVKVDWRAYYAREGRGRVALPTYPFTRQRYWFSSEPSRTAAPAVAASSRGARDVAGWLYAPVWNRVASTPAAPRPGSRWLVFADDAGVADRAIAYLAQNGQHTTVVRVGHRFEQSGDAEYCIRPSARDDYHALIRALADAGRLPSSVLHAWGVGGDPVDDAGQLSWEREHELGFWSVLRLAQSLADADVRSPIALTVATTGVHDVTGNERLSPAKRTVLGLCRVIPQEHANFSCTHVDLDGSTLDEWMSSEAGIAMLLDDARTSGAGTLAHRNGWRWVPGCQPLRFEDRAGHSSRLKSNGVYLITGGLGDIGLNIAEYLASAVQANLVLTSLSALPPVQEWDDYLRMHDAGDRNALRIERVRRLQALGARVLMLQADIADRDRMREVFAEAERAFGSIDGVVHAAGIVSADAFRPLVEIDEETCQRHFHAKVDGLAVLDELVRDRAMDFCVLMSSLSTVLGGLRFAAYASANAFMDGVAIRRQRTSRFPWLSIDWDGWLSRSAESRLGRAASSHADAVMTGVEGADAFRRILSADAAPQVFVSISDLQARIDRWARPVDLATTAATADAAPHPVHPRPKLQTEFEAPRTEIEKSIAAVWIDVLGVDRVGVNDSFFELGGDSVLGLQAMARLRQQLGLKLSAVRLYEAPTVALLAGLAEEKAHPKPAPVAVDDAAAHASSPAASVVAPSHATRREVVPAGATARDGRVDERIAIVGMAGRFPGASDLDTFWRNLATGVESRTVFSEDELKAAGVHPLLLRNPKHVRSGFVLDDVERFDAAFFGINPREAELLDPQHRLFLECAWEALEHGGYDPDTFSGSIGVFGGAALSGYYGHNVARNSALMQAVGGRQAMFGSVPDYMITRVAYKLNLTGPAYFVQTACSTSLVAVRLGCQSLFNRECDMALAGGVAVYVPDRAGYVYEEGGMLSPDGICRAFDARAGGTVFGSGAGLVVLKRYSDALADGDTIHAVIRGAATNNDGSLKVGFTAPGVAGQARVVADALRAADIPPETISYVEAHGTGTEMGDPIEIAALTRAYAATTDKRRFCAIGSVKPNIGHLDAAAGVSSLIKTVLALENRQIPPAINFERPNPKIEFDESPFYVNTTLQPWPANGTPRRAGVSSFGFGGTNAHVILEEAPVVSVPAPSRSHQPLVIAARTETALDAATVRLREALIKHPELSLADVAFTLATGRRHFSHRRAIVAADREAAIASLETFDARCVFTSMASGRERTVTFMFPGQGAQYVGMARGVYEEEPLFRQLMDECTEHLREPLGLDLRGLLFGDDRSGDVERQLTQTSVAQAAIFVVEYALARLWMSWGIKPSAMIGHSIGELVAACLANVFTLEHALQLVAERGRLMEQMPRGSMAAVPLDAERVTRMLGPDLCVAAVNAPGLCVVSGRSEAVDRFVEARAREGIECRHLHTSHAFHSALMQDAVAPFEEAARRAQPQPPTIPFVSNVTGTWMTDADAQDPRYWSRHIRQPVRFSEGIAQLLAEPDRLLLEIGPGNTLSGLVRQQTRGTGHLIVSSLRHPQEQTSDVATIARALSRLWVSGAAMSWKDYFTGEQRRRVPLPTYPFERQRYWVEPDEFSWKRTLQSLGQVANQDLSDWFHITSWKRSVAPVPAIVNGAAHDEACLVFEDGSALTQRFVRRLASTGRRLILVRPGARYERGGADVWTISPRSRSDYAALLKELQASQRLPAHIVHLWGLTGPAEHVVDDRIADEREQRGFYSLLYLAQAIGELGLTSPVRLSVVTDGVYEVTGDETLMLEKATALGPCRVIPQEFPNVRCGHFDLAIDESGALRDDQIDVLLADISSGSHEHGVAYRRGRRWTLGYTNVRLDALPDKSQPRLRDGGTYLITGGFGGIGLVLAEHLAETCKARLVLVGRRGVPPRDRWTDCKGSSDEGMRRRIEAVERLERLGAEVLCAEADVVDYARMREVVEQARARFGRIDGIVHAAGIAGGGMIQLKKPETAAAVLAPKVNGTRVLARLFHDRPLDFIVLCSSLTAITGGLGQVDYCGANAYLDAFARQYAQETGTFTVSVNWTAWREVGMAVDTDVPEDLREAVKGSRLAAGISNREGVEAFRRILARDTERQVAVLAADLRLQLEAALLPDEAPGTSARTMGAAVSTAETAGAAATHARPALQNAYVAPRTDAERSISTIWQELLGIERVGVNDNFFELGGHSLLAIRVMARVNETLRTEIAVAKLYEGLTVKFLAGLVEPAGHVEPEAADDLALAERRREKARRQKEQQQRRRVVMGR